MRHQRAVGDEGDVGGRRLDVGDDVRGENHDALTGELREQIAKADALLGVESSCGLIDDQKLWVVEQRLRDADSLLHSAGEAAQRATAYIGEVDEVQELVDAPSRRSRIQAFDGGEILQEFLGIQVGINAEILGQVAEHGPKSIGIRSQVGAIPGHLAFGGTRDGGQNAHQGRLARAVGAEQAEDAGLQLKTEAAQRPYFAAITLTDILDR